MTPLSRWRWLSEPPRWEASAHGLRLWPAAGTDFWQRTHYGFQADNGHFLSVPAPAGFTLSARVRMEPAHQYDQAGLMVRFSPECWLKTSVEHEPGGDGCLGAVVTNEGYSDWSIQPFPAGREYHLRIRNEHGCYVVSWSPDGAAWRPIRIAGLRGDGQPLCGVYACSPKGAGLMAEFFDIRLES